MSKVRDGFPERLWLVNLISGSSFSMRFKAAESLESVRETPRGIKTKALGATISCLADEAVALLGIETGVVGSMDDFPGAEFSLVVDSEEVIKDAPLGKWSFKDFKSTTQCLFKAVAQNKAANGFFMPHGTMVEVFVEPKAAFKVRTTLKVGLYKWDKGTISK